MDDEKKYALLIDADNVSSRYIEIVTGPPVPGSFFLPALPLQAAP